VLFPKITDGEFWTGISAVDAGAIPTNPQTYCPPVAESVQVVAHEAAIVDAPEIAPPAATPHVDVSDVPRICPVTSSLTAETGIGTSFSVPMTTLPKTSFNTGHPDWGIPCMSEPSIVILVES
jgi:hypothetical protein